MRSSYPSSQSFFDSTSDSIRAEDVDKCRNSVSFSSLADLFTNHSCKSDLFPHSRAPVLVPEDVHFPAKKKRECEERTSIWHEWGSGECQSENVAEESSGFTSELSRVGKSSGLFPSSFPILGSANISLVTEDFKFPARKKREEGSSWREERTSWQDWSVSVAAKKQEQPKSGISPVVGSIQDMYLSKPCTKLFDSVISSKPSPFSCLGAPVTSATDEVSFPARKKREERSFWQESCLDGSTQPECVVVPPPRDSAPGVGALADMYMKRAASSLFSKGSVGGSEEVVFPKRRNSADRNVWRDWTNNGYDDFADGTEQDCFSLGEASPPTSIAPTNNGLVSPPKDSCCRDGSSRVSSGENSLVSECTSRTSIHTPGDGAAGAMQSTSCLGEVCREMSGPTAGVASNVEGCDRFRRVGRTMDGGEASLDTTDSRVVANDVQESNSWNSSGEEWSGRGNGKYPPPLGSLSRQQRYRVPNHMPWVQLQPIRTKGRFVLQEVKVTQPVVFHPIRMGGRLVLELIGQDNSCEREDVGAKIRDGAVAKTNVKAFPVITGSNDSVAVKTPKSKIVEKLHGRQSLDSIAKEDLDRKRSPKVRSAETERKKSAKIWPVVCTPWEALPGEEILYVRTSEVAADMWERKSLNYRELCNIKDETSLVSDRGRENEKSPSSEGVLTADKSPPWLLGKLSSDCRTFDSRKTLHCGSQFRTSVERMGQVGNVLTIPRVRDSLPLRLQFQTLPRTSSLRNGLSGFNCPRVEGGGGLTRSKSIKSPSLVDVGAMYSGKEERASDPTRVRARVQDSRPSLSVYQGIIRDSFLSLATAHSFLRSLRTRPDISGEHGSRLPNCKSPVASVFSCADGMGKRHHEKNFWEQQPCVS